MDTAASPADSSDEEFPVFVEAGQRAESRQQTAERRQQTAESRQQTAESRQQIATESPLRLRLSQARSRESPSKTNGYSEDIEQRLYVWGENRNGELGIGGQHSFTKHYYSVSCFYCLVCCYYYTTVFPLL
jgi:hypothetical protein